ncbi:isochorismatase family protein [candidate division KSB1 bacterium]|nr:isochorismatase family protein [candidate division KSB1 bacterium]
MSNKALLIIDMLNDFIESTGALPCGEDARKMVPYIKKLAKSIRDEKGTVIWLCDVHKPGDREFEMFADHCVEGTHGAEIISELDVLDKDIVIEKTRFSGFYKTNLEETLERLAPSEVHVVGVCTSIGVMDTVSGLRDRDYLVYVHRHGVADFNQEAHSFSLSRIENILGAKII